MPISNIKEFLTRKSYWFALGAALLTLVYSEENHAIPVLDRIRSQAILRVCIWPDYYGITYRSPRNGQLSGIDIELSTELSRWLGVPLEYVDSSFTKLIEYLHAERCDIAMFAVGITPQRQQALKFSQPYLRSDIYGVTTRSNRVVRQWSDIDQSGVRVGVQAGTFMEPVMADTLKQARSIVIAPPLTREQELEAGRIDVFMTDYPYSRRLLDNADWARLVAPPQPFHPIPYAYAVKPGDEDWLREVDRFVAQIKRDGRLEGAAKRSGLAEILVRP
jgi:ABC-type amino acid transport substrate-binding protein